MTVMDSLVATGLEPVRDLFAEQCDADPTHSAQVAVYHRGELVLDLTGGSTMQPDSLLPVFSSSKGATAIVVALCVQRGLLDLDEPVARYWPEFAANGKAHIPVRQLLSHQAGLPGVDGGFAMEDVMEHSALAERLAAQRPMWRPGAGFMYHGLTIGTLADELVRRVDGRPVGEVLRDDVCGPRGIDVWMGTPESEDHRFVPFTLPTADELLPFLAEMGEAQAADTIAFESAPSGGMLGTLGRMNDVDLRRAGPPAAGVMANGRGLARLYACLRHDVGGPRLLTDDTIAQMSQLQVGGTELGSGLQARFAVIFQVPCPPRWAFGSWRAFGHDGAGGSLAFCEPTIDVAFGYTVQRVPLPGGMDARAVALARALRHCLSA